MFIDLHTNLVKNLYNSIENNILHISHSAKQQINKNIFQLLYPCEHFTFFSCDCLYLFTMSNKTVENSRVLHNNWWQKHDLNTVAEVLKVIKQQTKCIFSMSCYLWSNGIDFFVEKLQIAGKKISFIYQDDQKSVTWVLSNAHIQNSIMASLMWNDQFKTKP